MSPLLPTAHMGADEQFRSCRFARTMAMGETSKLISPHARATAARSKHLARRAMRVEALWSAMALGCRWWTREACLAADGGSDPATMIVRLECARLSGRG